MTRLFLVRHAHADWMPSGDRPLSARGQADAARVAGLLAPLDVAAIYSSPARRALETVEPLAGRACLRPIVLPELRERELPAQRAGDFEAVVRASWLDPERVVPGGESLAAAQARGFEAVRSLIDVHREEAIVVSTHGQLLALIVNALDSSHGHEFWTRLTLPDVYELELEGPRLRGMRRMWGGTGGRAAADLT
jgi:2,3-bisphosphoglycerate-dependent phosphoglycerate mutase